MTTMALTRRRMAEEPVSQLAIWARRLAIFALLVAVLAIGIEQWGALEIIPVLVTFGAALALAVLAILVAVAAFIMLWITAVAGVGAAITAIDRPDAAGLSRLSRLHSPIRCPRSRTSPPTRSIRRASRRWRGCARTPTRVTYPGLATAELQKDAYPDVEPLLVKVEPSSRLRRRHEGHHQAQMARRSMPAPPQPGREGHIEAIARSPIMGFRDDVVVRIRAARDGARVDVRSASRYGYTDFGANAARVRRPAGRHRRPRQPDKPERPAKVAKQPAKPDPTRRPISAAKR